MADSVTTIIVVVVEIDVVEAEVGVGG